MDERSKLRVIDQVFSVRYFNAINKTQKIGQAISLNMIRTIIFIIVIFLYLVTVTIDEEKLQKILIFLDADLIILNFPSVNTITDDLIGHGEYEISIVYRFFFFTSMLVSTIIIVFVAVYIRMEKDCQDRKIYEFHSNIMVLKFFGWIMLIGSASILFILNDAGYGGGRLSNPIRFGKLFLVRDGVFIVIFLLSMLQIISLYKIQYFSGQRRNDRTKMEKNAE